MSQSHDLMPDPEQGLRARESLLLVQRAVANGWVIPDEWKAVLPVQAMKFVMDQSRAPRDRIRAMELLRALAKDNIEAMALLDKMERPEQEQAPKVIVTFDQGGPVWSKRVNNESDREE